MLKTLTKVGVPVKDAVKEVEEDSCPGWNLVAEERLKIADRARALMAVEGSHEVERLVDTSDFDTLYAELRQVALDMAASWLSYWRARADRLQQRLETQGVVADAVLDVITNEGQAILRFLAAVGRCGR
jgi:hypothetical protein